MPEYRLNRSLEVGINPQHIPSRTLLCMTAVALLILLTAPGTGEAKLYTDAMGRKVEIPSRPQRIISLAPSITETLFALHLEEEIVGVTRFCDYPEAACSKPKIGGFTSVSIEKIIALHPDIVIATADGNTQGAVIRLEALHIPVYVVNPENFDDIYNMIIAIGSITAQEETALDIVHELRTRKEYIVSLTRNRERPDVFLQLGLTGLITAGDKTFLNELIKLAGGRNIAGNVPIRYPRFTMEEIILRKPDIIIIYAMQENMSVIARAKAAWQHRNTIPAVRQNRIHNIPAGLIDRPSPRIIEGLEALTKIIHPEILFEAPLNR